MKILDILKIFNCGLNSLNQELQNLGLNFSFSINSKISFEDYCFLFKLLTEKKKEEELLNEIRCIRKGIKNLYLENSSDPQSMGKLERMQFYNYLLTIEEDSILMPYVDSYSEENFWKVYNWHKEWERKSFIQKRKDIDSFVLLKDNFDDLRDIQIRGLAKYIIKEGKSSLSMPLPLEENYKAIIFWYKSWITKSEEERQKDKRPEIIEEEFEDWEMEYYEEYNEKRRVNKIEIDTIDEETAIMSALMHGEGDRFGFD